MFFTEKKPRKIAVPVESTRKLIRMGKNGLVVTVPRAWANYLKLKPGDRVRVVANDELTISPCIKGDEGDSVKAQ